MGGQCLIIVDTEGLQPRNLVLSGLQASTLALTGATPFFRVINHRSNFSEVLNLVGNPLERGIDLLFPDNTPYHLDRLEESALREGLVLSARTSATKVAFVPKAFLGLGHQADDPAAIIKALGDLVLILERTVHIDHIRVITPPH